MTTQLTSLIVGQMRTGHSALPCFRHALSLKPPFAVSSSSSAGWFVSTQTTGGASLCWSQLKSPTGWSSALWRTSALCTQSDRFVNFATLTHQAGRSTQMCHEHLSLFAFRSSCTHYRSSSFSASRTKREATSCPSRAEWRKWNRDEWWWTRRWSPWVTSGSIKTASSRTRYSPSGFETSPPVQKLGGNYSKLHWLSLLRRCSWPRTWASKLWATSSRQPRWFCGQRVGSPSRRGRPRWEDSSPVSPSRAWCWMSKVPEHICFLAFVFTPFMAGAKRFFLFKYLCENLFSPHRFRWQNVRQGPRGDYAGERWEAKPTVGVGASLKTPFYTSIECLWTSSPCYELCSSESESSWCVGGPEKTTYIFFQFLFLKITWTETFFCVFLWGWIFSPPQSGPQLLYFVNLNIQTLTFLFERIQARVNVLASSGSRSWDALFTVAQCVF